MYTKKTFLLSLFRLLITPFGNEIYEKINPTPICPCDKEDWNLRAKEFNCQERQYTCILNENNKLVETCMHIYEIDNPDGCPQIGMTTSKTGPQLHNRLSKCNVTGCPRPEDGLFTTAQLYKYPICWVPSPARMEGYDLTPMLCRKRSTEGREAYDRQQMNLLLEKHEDSYTLLMFMAMNSFITCIIVMTAGLYITVRRCRKKYRTSQSEESSML